MNQQFIRVGGIVCYLTAIASMALVATTLVATTWAEVVRFEITDRQPFADGQSFGEVGAYERIVGRVDYAIDPGHRVNGQIVDLPLASHDEQGRVTFSSDLFILAPQDLSKGNGAVFYDVNNRGNKLAIRFFNDGPGGNDPTDPGNGFLMREGYTIVWSGWDGELLAGGSRLQLRAPIAEKPIAENEAQPLTGLVRYEICTDKESQRESVNGGNHGAYRPTTHGIDTATLTWRLRVADNRVPIPRDQFQLTVHADKAKDPAELPVVELELAAGFRRGYLYELIYEAQDPLVHGVCFASVRDLITALKHREGEGNPLTVGDARLEFAYGFGVSQSGRFLREYLHQGFNEDERGRTVFDGLMPHVAGGGLGSFNHRFAQPTAYSTQHNMSDWPPDRFPFAYETQTDPLSQQTDGIMQRVAKTKTAPKVMHTQSAAEYWSRAGSLVHTDPMGTRDASPPTNVRIYAFGGTQHGPSSFPPSQGKGQALANPGDYRPLLRGLLTALDAWCRDDVTPPASCHPRIDDGTLTPWQQASTGFPAIPGVRYPEVINQPNLLDLGPRWLTARIIDHQPPPRLGAYRVLAAKCDADGNPLGCLSPPEVSVPLATFTGWNLRHRDYGAENELVGLNGSYIPLPKSASARQASGDPRLSLTERFGDLDGYLKQLEKRCQQMVSERYLLAEDVERITKRQRERAEPLLKDD